VRRAFSGGPTKPVRPDRPKPNATRLARREFPFFFPAAGRRRRRAFFPLIMGSQKTPKPNPTQNRAHRHRHPGFNPPVGRVSTRNRFATPSWGNGLSEQLPPWRLHGREPAPAPGYNISEPKRSFAGRGRRPDTQTAFSCAAAANPVNWPASTDALNFNFIAPTVARPVAGIIYFPRAPWR